MKKLFAILLVLVMATALLTGCGDPVYDDFVNFLNVDMVDVNASYTKITDEVATWENIEDDAFLAESISNVLLPLVNDSLASLENINPETEEVKALKEKYVGVMDAYKAGFEALLEGCETQDEATINAGNESLEKGVELLDEYNAALEALAEEHGAEIEY